MSSNKFSGFTLIELVAGIIAFSIVLTIVVSLVVPQSTRSAQPLFQVRATELAQGLLNEITAKGFDENSSLSGGAIRCSETNVSFSAPDCTTPDNLGPDSETRPDYDDVDDFNGLVLGAGTPNPIVNSLGQVIVDAQTGVDLYQGFTLSVSVFYDENFDGVDDGAISGRKLIRVTVTPPTGSPIAFTTYKSNF